jgi:hypothetical protein
MTRLFEKADQLLAMSRGNVITGLTFSRHSSGVSGSFQIPHHNHMKAMISLGYPHFRSMKVDGWW